MKLRYKLALLSGTGVLCGLVIAEVALRMLSPQGLPLLVQTSTPDHAIESRAGMAEKDAYGALTFDDQGFRMGSGLPYDRSVLFLGDSFTEGRGVGDSETFARATEDALRRDGLQVRSLNAGQRGFGTAQQLKVLRRLLARVAVDAVVLQVFPMNDLSDNLADGSFGVQDGRLIEYAIPRQPLRARFYDWLAHSRIRGSYLVRSLVNQLQMVDPAAPFEAATSRELGRVLLAEIVASARAAGLPIVVLVVPTREAQRRMREPASASTTAGSLRFEYILDVVQGLHVPWVDAGAVIPDLAADADTGDGGHFGKTGNRLVGEAIARQLAPLLRSRGAAAR